MKASIWHPKINVIVSLHGLAVEILLTLIPNWGGFARIIYVLVGIIYTDGPYYGTNSFCNGFAGLAV